MNTTQDGIDGVSGSHFASSQPFRRLVEIAFPVFVSVALTGCSDGRPDRVAVSGVVLIDGQPLTQGIVQFVTEGQRPSAGKLDPEGRFTLSCYEENDGIVPGKHRVLVAAREIISESKVRWLAPPKYGDYSSSGLSFEITEPTDDLTIELTWDGGKPFVQ